MEDHRNKKHLKPQKLTISAALPSINRVKKIRCKATGQSILISANKASKQKIPKDQSRLSHPDSQEERSYFCSSRMKSIQRWVWRPEVNLPVPLQQRLGVSVAQLYFSQRFLSALIDTHAPALWHHHRASQQSVQREEEEVRNTYRCVNITA